MKKNTHVVVPSARFRLLRGKENLTTYRFNEGIACHRFCRTCGVQCFYHPRSNPDGVAVTIHCIRPGSIDSLEVRHFDGLNWESHIDKTNIRSMSKE